MARSRSLWTCPACGERFTSRNQWHSCGSFPLNEIFSGCDPKVRKLYDRFLALLKEVGPVRVIPQKSRVAFQVRMRFAAVTPQKTALKGHLVLAERHESPCFVKIETLAPRSHLHVFRLAREEDLGKDLRRFLRESYRVGRQEHLRKR
jgi:hypothetical protein